MSPSGIRPRFVVGTGRCGSTLLSRMLACHRDVVSISEFFTGLDWGRRFAPGVVSGAELAEMLAGEQTVVTEVLARGYTADEIQYPFGAPGARHAPGEPMPWLAVSMAPRLTDDPDALVDDLLAFAAGRPSATMAQHYDAVFAWLCARRGATCWVERSGSSVDYAADLLALFPDALVVHLHRNGDETALSLRDHPFYRLALAMLYDLLPPGLPEDEAITHAIETPPPVEVAGRYWADQVERGVAALSVLPADRVEMVTFEDLLADPASVMARLAAFFELPDDPGFITRSATLVGPPPQSRVARLSRAEREALHTATAPGRALLGR